MTPMEMVELHRGRLRYRLKIVELHGMEDWMLSSRLKIVELHGMEDWMLSSFEVQIEWGKDGLWQVGCLGVFPTYGSAKDVLKHEWMVKIDEGYHLKEILPPPQSDEASKPSSRKIMW